MNNDVGLIDFLGQVLGPDYAIALYERNTEDFIATAVSNGHICDCNLGATLPAALRQRLEDDSTALAKHRATPVAYVTAQHKILRASIYALHDPLGQLTSAICIYFDDTRYRDLSAQLLRLRHPDSFVDHYFEAARGRDPTTSRPTMRLGSEPLSPERVLQQHFPPSAMPAPDKLSARERGALIAKLAESGFFELKGAVTALASHLNCSPATIYRYVARHSSRKNTS